VAIKRFRHKGLERFFTTGNTRGIQATHADRLRLILGRLNAAADPRDMNLPSGMPSESIMWITTEAWR
jgi:proteic killer suppression protein